MTKNEGFAGKPIEQHPSSASCATTIDVGKGLEYYKASLNMPTEVERLKARIAELEAALKPFAELLQRDFSIIANDERYADGFSATALLRLGDLRAARVALEKKND